MHFFYPVRLVDDGNATGAAQVKAHAEAQIGAMLDMVDAELASHGKSWLLGDTYQRRRSVPADARSLDAQLRSSCPESAQS